jgi:hypothetical protein
VAGCGQRFAQDGFDVDCDDLGGFDLTVSLGEGAGEPLHLGGEQVLRDGPG